jgi:hypothetical protein
VFPHDLGAIPDLDLTFALYGKPMSAELGKKCANVNAFQKSRA